MTSIFGGFEPSKQGRFQPKYIYGFQVDIFSPRQRDTWFTWYKMSLNHPTLWLFIIPMSETNEVHSPPVRYLEVLTVLEAEENWTPTGWMRSCYVNYFRLSQLEPLKNVLAGHSHGHSVQSQGTLAWGVPQKAPENEATTGFKGGVSKPWGKPAKSDSENSAAQRPAVKWGLPPTR